MKEEHRIECAEDNLFVCSTCHVRHMSSIELSEHMRKAHEMTDDHACDQCDKGFPSKIMLTIHLVETHGFDPMRNSDAFSAKVVEDPQTNHLKCDQCDKLFLNHRTLSKHKKQFHEENNIKCDFCDNNTRAICYLYRHCCDATNTNVT